MKRAFITRPVSFRLGVRAQAQKKLTVVQAPQCPVSSNVHKREGQGLRYRDIGDKFAVSTSTAYERVNTLGMDENLFTVQTSARTLVPTKGQYFILN